MLRKFPLLGFVVALIIAGPAATRAQDLTTSSAGARLNIPAPELAIKEVVKGTSATIAEGAGKSIYVVEFWATWCPPCRTSIPHLTEMQKKFKDKGVIFVGLTSEDVDVVRPFVDKQGDKMDYVVAIDDSRKTNNGYMKPYQVNGIPHAFIVDKNSKIVWHGHPMAGLDTALEQIVAGTYDVVAAQRAIDAKDLVKTYKRQAVENSPEASATGAKILADGAKDAQMLNELAWFILTSKSVKTRDHELALKAAQLGCEASNNKNAMILDTLARALYDTGKKDEAIAKQREAIAANDNPQQARELEETLKKYQSGEPMTQ